MQTLIIDNIYMGDWQDAKNHKDDYIIFTVADDSEFRSEFHFYPLIEGYNIENEKLLPWAILDLIRTRNNASNKIILVHCSKGLSRSPAVIIGYLMATKLYTLYDAKIYMESRGRTLMINKYLEKLLVDFSKERELPIRPNEKREMSISIEDAKLCLGGNSKDIILEGLREVELLKYKINIADKDDILDDINKLLDHTEIEIKKRSLEIITDMIGIVGREKGENSEDRKKLINKYCKKILNIVNDENIDIRMNAVKALIEMDNDNFIDPLTNFILTESNEIYSRFRLSYSTMRNKNKLKRFLLIKLKEDLSLSEDIRKRIREIIEEIRRDY